MASRNLKIDQLELDLWNPRINRAEGQHEVMQRIIDDQDDKLAVLTESISEEGLNPMERLLVIKSERKGKYVVLEGNRRTLALKILNSPTVLTGLEVRSALKKRLEKAAQLFDRRLVEPVSCFELAGRAEASSWLELRHNGESDGRGTVDWSSVARSRFAGGDPALQALDFVRQHADLTDDQRGLLAGRFPLTTLDRLLSNPAVRQKIGVEIKGGRLLTFLPAEEVLKPLRKMVLDLAEKKIKVDHIKTKDQQVKYATNEVDRVDLQKKSANLRPLEGMIENEFPISGGRGATKRVQRPTVRNVIVPRHCHLNVTNTKTAEIYTELRKMRLDTLPNAIAVMLRVFIENSVDHYLTKIANPPIPLSVPTNGGGDKLKSLEKKIEETLADMVNNGVDRKDLDGIRRRISDKKSPLSVDLLNSYVHSRFVAATERELTVAWDGAQPFFERIWK